MHQNDNQFFARYAPKNSEEATPKERSPVSEAARLLRLALYIEFTKKYLLISEKILRIKRSLLASWAIGGFGWGGFIASVIMIFYLWK